MPDDSTVSCIIPVHNGAAFIGEALESIFAQKGPVLEVVVVDDGSTDASARIAASFAGVRVVSRSQGGVAAARNDGLRSAYGDYVAFLDADDLWLPGKLDAQLAALAVEPAPAYCVTMARHVVTDADGTVPPGDPGDVKLGRLMQCLLARRADFDRVGPLDTGTSTRADQDWFLRADQTGLKQVVVPEVFTIRRIHGDNHSIRSSAQVLDDFLTIAKRNLDRKRDKGLVGGSWTP